MENLTQNSVKTQGAVNAKETQKAEKLKAKMIAEAYKELAQQRDEYQLQTANEENNSLLFHLKETQRRENKIFIAIIGELVDLVKSNEELKTALKTQMELFETVLGEGKKATLVKFYLKFQGSQPKTALNALKTEILKVNKDFETQINTIYEKYVIDFSIDFSYFKQGLNYFKLLGFATKGGAITYGLTDRVKHSFALKLISDYSFDNHFEHVTTIETNFTKADALSKAKKEFLNSDKGEEAQFNYLTKIDEIFNPETTNKKTKKKQVVNYGSATIKQLFKNALFTLIKWEGIRVEKVAIKKVCEDIVSTLTEKSKLNEAQKRFLLDNIGNDLKNKMSSIAFETCGGGVKALELLNQIEADELEKANERARMQQERKEAKEREKAEAKKEKLQIS